MGQGSYNYQVNLQFTADTKQAQAQLQSLKQELKNLSTPTEMRNRTGLFNNFTVEAQKAQSDILSLRNALESATNVNTGKLDLTAFNNSLRASNQSLSSYKQSLFSLGSSGREAFLGLSQAIALGEQPLKRSSKLMGELWTSMKNTIGWKINNVVLNAFVGSIQKAYNYTKDLNESLNDIRIVTGYNTDKMAEFAVEANKAAKELATTTKNYAKASLIYFQQGLGDTEVNKRTQATIKLANVTSQSASEVADQMTAIWNNFDNGTKSLEYYADVIVALGAATASSSDEIATGLEKFASSAETVGLSYEYATAALATVTATTRQSADVVGTAFKTLFARMSSLKLGETLDDGVTLSNYSQALNSIGVNILDNNNNLKDMDTILSELGSKWDNLTSAEQTALAQTVAGTRQYSQFLALMNNWDFMEKNVKIATDATGILTKQNDIYKESWKAASYEVQAAAETIYQALLDDKFFISLTKGFAGVLEYINKWVEAIGGARGALGLLGVVLTSVFDKQLSQSLDQAVYNLRVMTGAAEADAAALQQAAVAELQSYQKALPEDSVDYIRIDAMTQQIALKNQLKGIENEITEEKRKQLETEIAQVGIINDIITKQVKSAEEAKQEAKQAEEQFKSEYVEELDVNQLRQMSKDAGNKSAFKKMLSNKGYDKLLAQDDETKRILDAFYKTGSRRDTFLEELSALTNNEGKIKIHASTTAEELTKTAKDYVDISTFGLRTQKEIVSDQSGNNDWFNTNENDFANFFNQNADKYTTFYQDSGAIMGVDEQAGAFQNAKDAYLGYVEALQDGSEEDKATSINNLKEAMIKLAEAENEASSEIKITDEEFAKMGITTEEGKEQFQELISKITAATTFTIQYKTALASQQKYISRVSEEIKQANKAYMSFGTLTVTTLRGANQLITGISSLSAAFKNLGNSDMSFMEKFTSILKSTTMALPMIIAGFGSLAKAVNSIKGMGGIFNSVFGTLAGISQTELDSGTKSIAELVLIKKKVIESDGAQAKGIWKLVAAKYAENNLSKLQAEQAELKELSKKKVLTADEKERIATLKQTIATEEQTAANYALKASMIEIVVVIGLIVAAIAAIVAIIKVVQANSPEGKLKAAKEEATKLAQSLDEVRTAAESLKETFNSYDSIKEKLQECARGTQEWYDALQEANEETNALLEQYPELVNYLETINGVQVISDQGKEYVLNKQQEAVNNAQLASAMSNQKVRDQEIAVQKSNNKTNIDVSGISGAEAQHIIDSSDETTSGTYGTTSGTYQSEINNQVLQSINANKDKYLNTEQILTEEELKKVLSADLAEYDLTADSIDDLTSQLMEMRDDTKQLTDSINTNNKLLAIENQQLGAGVLSDNERYQALVNSDDTDSNVLKAIEVAVGGSKRTAAEENLSKYSYINKNSTAEIDEYIAATYGSGLSSKDATYDKDSNSYKLTINGTERGFDLDDVKYFKASQEANSDTATEDHIIQTMQELGNNNEALLAFLANQDISAVTDISGLFIQNEDGSFTLDKNKIIEQLGGEDQYQQILSYFGYESLDEMQSVLAECIAGWDEATAAANALKEEQAELDNLYATAAKEVGTSTEAFKQYSKILQSAYNIDEKSAIKAAKANIKFANGVDALTDTMKNNYKILKSWANGGEATSETFEALATVAENLQDVFGVEVSNDFIKDHLEDLNDLANATDEEIEALSLAASKDYIAHLGIDFEGLNIDLDTVNTALDDLSAQNISIGTNVNTSESIDALNELLLTGKMNAAEVTAALNAIGYEPDIQYIDVTTHDHSDTKTWVEDGSGSMVNGTYRIQRTDHETTTRMPYIATSNTSAPEGIDLGGKSLSTGTGLTSISTASSRKSSIKQSTKDKTSSSGGSDKKDIEEDIERYKELDDAIESVKNSIDRLAKARERLFTVQQISAIDEEIEYWKKQAELLEQRIAMAKKFLADDKATFSGYTNKLVGVEVQYTTDGQIANYYDVYDAIKTAYDKDKISDDQYDQWKKYLDLVDSSSKEVIDTENELIDAQNKQQDLRMEQIETIYDEKQAVRDLHEEYLEFIQDQLKSRPTTILQQFSILSETTESTQKRVKDLEEEMESLNNGLRDGTISLADYEKGVQDINKESLSLQQTISELSDTFVELFENAFNTALDNISKFTDNIDKAVGTLDNLKNIMILLNGEYDYNNLKAISEANLQAAKSLLDTNKDTFDTFADYYNSDDIQKLKEERDKARENITKLEQDLASAEAENNQNKINDLQNKIAANQVTYNSLNNTVSGLESRYAELQSQYYASLEQYLTAVTELNDTIVNGLVYQMQLEETLKEGYDLMRDKMDLLISHENNFYDATNKAYQISKLQYNLDKDIAKTTSKYAKEQLAAFNSQIKALQAKGKLSKEELGIAQAQYEVLKAQIALEEAQNNKTNITLQRDTNGNFGYVYSIGQNDKAEKEQALADAENNEYNKKLETAKNYAQKIIDARQALGDKLRETYTNNNLTAEEKRAQLQYYYDMYSGFISDYQNVLDSNGLRDMLKDTEFGNMESVLSLVNAPMSEVQDIFKTYYDKANEVAQQTQNSKKSVYDSTQLNDDLSTSTQYITSMTTEAQTANEELSTMLQKIGNIASAWNDVAINISDAQTVLEKLNSTTGDTLKALVGITEPEENVDYSSLMVEAYNNEEWSKFATYSALRSQKMNKMGEADTTGYIIEGLQNGSITSANDISKYIKSKATDNADNQPIGEDKSKDPTPSEESNTTSANKQYYTQSSDTTLSSTIIRAMQSYYGTAVDGVWGKNSTAAAGGKSAQEAYNDLIAAYFGTGKAYFSESQFNNMLTAFKSQYNGNYDDYFAEKLKEIKQIGGQVFDTGGYTGGWSDGSGKLALLHSKELVLNALDTERILNAVDIVRQISNYIDAASSFSMSDAALRAHQYSKAGSNAESTVNNVYNINADFPNVSSRDEIQAAFNQLANQAAQLANTQKIWYNKREV